MTKPSLGSVVHEFASPTGLLADVEVSNWDATESVPGGFISCSGSIQPDTVKNNPGVFVYGATWTVTLAETGETVWAGRLLDPTPQTYGAWQLNAKGWGTLADRQVERLLYQTRSTEDWTPADEDPHSYTNDNKHFKIDGSDFGGGGVDYGDERKIEAENVTTTYQLPALQDGQTYTVGITGRTKDVKDEREKTRIKFYVLEDGVEIEKVERVVENTYDNGDTQDQQKKDNDHLAKLSFLADSTKTYTVAVKTVKMRGSDVFVLSYARYGKTADVTSDKIEARVTGKRLIWKVPNNTRFRGGETTGLVFWAKDNPLSRVAATIKRNRPDPNFDLEILGTTGPSGDFELLATYGLDRADTKEIDLAIAGEYDQITIRLKRKEGNDARKVKRLVISLSEVRVSAIATSDDFTVSDVARDIVGRMHVDDWLIQDSNEQVLPLDAQDVTLADLLSDVHLLNDWRWLILDFGNGPVMDSGPWDTRHWFVHGADVISDLTPLERYDEVRYPYRYPGGVQAWDTVRPDDDELPGGVLNTYTLEIDDPLPGKDVMETFASRIANYLHRSRAAGTCRLALVRDRQDVEHSAHLLHAGDLLTLTSTGMTLRIKEVRRTDNSVTVTFDDGHALLDQLLRRRSRRLAMGRSAADATLADVMPGRPEAPSFAATPLYFRVREVKDSLDYKAILNWNEITNDEFGEPLEVDRYRAELRPVIQTTAGDAEKDWQDESGQWWKMPKTEPDEGHVQRKTVGGREDEDTVDEPPPTKAVFEDVDKPKKWYYQGRVRAIDAYNRKGRWTDWTDPVLPFATAPNAVPPTVVMVSHPGWSPDNGLYFDREDKNRQQPLRALVEWEEITTWDIPGGDDDSDLAGYVLEFRRCTSAGAKIAGVESRRRFIPAKRDDDEDDTARTVFNKVWPKKFYQFRIRTLSKYGHKGDWYGGPGATHSAGWSLAVQSVDTIAPPVPVNVTLIRGVDKVGVDWEAPDDPDDPDEIHPDVSHYQVQASQDADFDPIWKKDRYVGATRKVFHAGANTDDYETLHYFRVRSVDAVKNKSAWVYATKTGPGSETIGDAEGVKPRAAREVATFTYSGVLEANESKPRYYVDANYEIRKVVASLDTPGAVTIQVRVNDGTSTNDLFTTAMSFSAGVYRRTKVQADMVGTRYLVEDDDFIKVQITSPDGVAADMVVQVFLRKIGD